MVAVVDNGAQLIEERDVDIYLFYDVLNLFDLNLSRELYFLVCTDYRITLIVKVHIRMLKVVWLWEFQKWKEMKIKQLMRR